jgi:hypothetical protein
MFPITLSVVRLSGVGADSLFMGVIRPAVSSALASNHVVNFHIAADGIVLCPDKSCMDAFGIQPVDVIGRSFSNLTTDVEGVSKCAPRGGGRSASKGEGDATRRPMHGVTAVAVCLCCCLTRAAAGSSPRLPGAARASRAQSRPLSQPRCVDVPGSGVSA